MFIVCFSLCMNFLFMFFAIVSAGFLSFAYCVRNSLSLVDISVFPVINAVSIVSQPVT